MYKVLTNKEFTDETDSPFKKVVFHKKLYLNGAQYIIEIWHNSQKRW